MTPPLTTRINREYALRFLGVALLFIAFAGWFLYDGLWGYPKENAAIAPIAAELAKQSAPEATQPMTASDWMNDAKTGTAPLVAAFQAAGHKPPAKYADTFTSWIRASDPRAQNPAAAHAVLSLPLHGEDEIRTQFISAAISLLAALALLLIVLRRFLTTFRLDDTALTHTFAGRITTYPLCELIAIDDSQWTKRAIAKVAFANRPPLTLDAWHHAGLRPIHEALLAHLPTQTPAPKP